MSSSLFSDLRPEFTSGLIIHHWDTDGICSAALLLNYFAEHYPKIKLKTFTPTITNYYLTDEQYQQFQAAGYQFVLTCDINFQADTVNRLAEIFPGQTYIFDHHAQTPFTNVHYYNKPHPACASFIAQELELLPSLIATIAMVGDKEEAIQQDPVYYPLVEADMAKYDLTFSQLLTMRQLIDSNYIVDDYQGIVETIHLLQSDPVAVLTDVRLQSNVEKMNETIEQHMGKTLTPLSDTVLFLELDTSLNVLSQVTRHLARAYPDNVIFTRQRKGQQYTCYVRRRNYPYDMRLMINFARSLGLNAGGKEDVVGIIIPSASLDEFFPKIEAQLKTV